MFCSPFISNVSAGVGDADSSYALIIDDEFGNGGGAAASVSSSCDGATTTSAERDNDLLRECREIFDDVVDDAVRVAEVEADDDVEGTSGDDGRAFPLLLRPLPPPPRIALLPDDVDFDERLDDDDFDDELLVVATGDVAAVAATAAAAMRLADDDDGVEKARGFIGGRLRDEGAMADFACGIGAGIDGAAVAVGIGAGIDGAGTPSFDDVCFTIFAF
jgi:hypothetical protein